MRLMSNANAVLSLSLQLLGMYKNQLEEIHILRELNAKKDMKIKELEDLLEDFKMVDC